MTKKLVKMKVNRPETIEVEVEFPLYRAHHLDESAIYYRVEEDGKTFGVHNKDYRDAEVEFSIGTGAMGDSDYALGHGQYKSSEAEFSEAIAAGVEIVRRFPGYAENEELGRLLAENERLAKLNAQWKTALEAATAERDRLKGIRDDVAEDVRHLGVGFTMHTPDGPRRLAPEGVSFRRE